MLRRLQELGLVRPTLAVLATLAVLVGLGVWQLERKAWKEGLIQAIVERTAKPSVPLQSLLRGGEELPPEYTRVTVRGRFLNEHEKHLYAPEPAGAGYHVYTPMLLEGGRSVFVNRGWIPEALKNPATRAAQQPQGEVEIIGLVRWPGAKVGFTPRNNYIKNLWFWRDVKGMAASAFPGGEDKVLPFFVEEEAQPGKATVFPRPGVTSLALPSRHLEYALTWFGLALVLLVIFGRFVWVRAHEKPRP